MSYVTPLVNQALASEQQLDRVVAEGERLEHAQSNLVELEQAWQRAIEDGSIDPSEAAELTPLFEAAGLGDPFAQGTKLSQEAIERLSGTIKQQWRQLSDAGGANAVARNLTLSDVLYYWQTASAASSQEHGALMNCISNMRA